MQFRNPVTGSTSECHTLKKLIMFLTSSSNPKSIMRSASSIHRYLQFANPNRFFSSMSISLPGVATTIWSPLFSTWPWSPMDMPPIHSSVFKGGYLGSFEMAAVHERTFSYVCVASSREGQRTTPTGPSPRTKGRRTSSSRASMMRGRQKARVFPEPVNAMPIMSRPEKLWGVSALGYTPRRETLRSRCALQLNGGGGGDFLGLEELKHGIWDFHILKHYESPCVQNADVLLTSKRSIGGGMSSPSTIMWYFSRRRRCCSSVRSRIYFGGLHLSQGSAQSIVDTTGNVRRPERLRILYTFCKLQIRGELPPARYCSEYLGVGFLSLFDLCLFCI